MIRGERLSAISHAIGLVLALIGSAQLLSSTLSHGGALQVIGAAVFGLSMCAVYATSTVFHSTRGRLKLCWQRADHCAIYLLIAGTYTPFALVMLHGASRWAMLAAAWALAVVGFVREWRAGTHASPSLPLYIGMGWVGVIAAAPLAARLDTTAAAWLIAGALFYSAGTVFYRNVFGARHAHGIWHLFVLAGSISHYVAVAGFVL